jgi:hypothetical protein
MQTGKTDHAISAPHRMRRNYTQTIRATLGLVPQAVRATSSTRSTTCDIAKGGEHSPYSRCPLITPVSGPAGLIGWRFQRRAGMQPWIPKRRRSC